MCAIALCGIVMADIPIVNVPVVVSNGGLSSDTVSLYTPCVTCYVGPVPTPTPAPTWTTIEVGFTINPTVSRVGQQISLTGYQLTGAELGVNAKWQYVIQGKNDVQVVNSQNGIFTPRKASAYSISLTARDNINYINGYKRLNNVFTAR